MPCRAIPTSARHDEQDEPGWWDLVVGPGKSIDTDRYFVVCPNILGGCRGTTGPNSLPPGSERPYGAEFPTITVGDMVRVQKDLIDHLGIERLRAVIGGSLGGHMALWWATRYPDRVAGAVPIAASPRLTSQALAFNVVGRNAILRDPAYQDGQYYGSRNAPAVGLSWRGCSGTSPTCRGKRWRRSSAPSGLCHARFRPSSRTSSPSARTWPTRATSSSNGSTPIVISR